MTPPFDIRSQQELEVLRRLAEEVEDVVRYSTGVHSERLGGIQAWSQTGILELLRSFRTFRARDPSRWENYPSENDGVLVINGQRMKLVPVEPDERMVKDDNATDPTVDAAIGQPVPFLHADVVRYIYKQLLRVAPPVTLDATTLRDLLMNAGQDARHEALSGFCAYCGVDTGEKRCHCNNDE